MKTINIPFRIFCILISLLGKLSDYDTCRLVGDKDAQEIVDWYFDNRNKINE